MNNELINFHHEMFGDIRAIEKDGEPWFVGKDVAVALGYSNARDALAKHIDNEDKKILTSQNATLEKLNIPNRGLTIINESGLPRPLLEASAGEGLQALGHRRGAALHPSPRSLCHGTDDREDHRVSGVRHRTAEESPTGAEHATRG